MEHFILTITFHMVVHNSACRRSQGLFDKLVHERRVGELALDAGDACRSHRRVGWRLTASIGIHGHVGIAAWLAAGSCVEPAQLRGVKVFKTAFVDREPMDGQLLEAWAGGSQLSGRAQLWQRRLWIAKEV